MLVEKSFWQKILASFNFNFYQEIAFQSLKKSFKFLALFLLLIALILTLRYSYDFYKFSREIVEMAPIFLERLKDFPEIKIEKGEVILPKEKFVEKWPDFSLIIDREGKIEDYLEEDYLEERESALILLKNKAIWKSPRETRIYSLLGINYFGFKFDQEKEIPILSFNGQVFQLTQEKIKFWADRIIPIIPPFLFIFTFLSLFIAKSIRILIFSLLSLIINKVKKLNLAYSNLLNIGIFALIPPLIFETVVKLADLKIPYFGLIYSLLYLAFLIPGLLKVKIPKV